MHTSVRTTDVEEPYFEGNTPTPRRLFSYIHLGRKEKKKKGEGNNNVCFKEADLGPSLLLSRSRSWKEEEKKAGGGCAAASS